MDIHNELKAMMDINLKTEFDLVINEVIEKSYQEDAKELGSELALIVKSQWIQMKPYLFLAYCLGAKAQAVPEGFVLVPKDSLKVALSWMNEDIDPWQMGGDSFAELYEHKPILEVLIEAQEQKG